MLSWIGVVLITAVTQAPPTASAAVKFSEEAIAALVRDLGSDDFKTRENASRNLWLAGDKAAAALEQAEQTGDTEVRTRAKLLLQKIDRGLTPDTSDEDRRLLENFWTTVGAADTPERRELARRVGPVLNVHSLLKLLESEKTLGIRFALMEAFTKAHPHAEDELIKDLDPRLEILLDAQASYDNSLRLNYIEYLLITGRLEAKTVEAVAEAQRNPNNVPMILRAIFMLRAKGEVGQALDLQINDRLLRRDLAIEAGRWKDVPLVKLTPLGANEKVDPTTLASENPYNSAAINKNPSQPGAWETVDNLAYQAAICRWADDDTGATRRLDSILETAGRRTDQDWAIARSLLLNDEHEKAFALLERNQHANLIFMLRAAQGHRREALRAIGYPRPCDDPKTWYNTFEPSKKAKLTPANRLGLALDVATVVNATGNAKEAADIFDVVAESANGELLPFMSNLIHKELAAGMRDKAIAHAVLYGKRRDQRAMLSSVLPELSEAWWIWWQKRNPNQTTEKQLGDLLRLIKPFPRDELPLTELQPLLQDFAKYIEDQEPIQKSNGLMAIAGIARRHGQWDLTLEYGRRAVELQPTTENRFTLATHCMDSEHYAEAAQGYERCAQSGKNTEVYQAMQAESLQRAGQEQAGQKLATIASLSVFGNTRNRANLATNLQQRGFQDAFLRECDILLRTGELHNVALNTAATAVAKKISFSDPARAANLLKRELLRNLASDSPATIDTYVKVPGVLHKTLARAALNQGKLDEALEHLRLSALYLPQDFRRTEEFVLKLEQLGHKEQALEVYERSYNFHREVLSDFPDDAWNRSGLAWLLARTGRRLDEALKQAQKAIELVPDNGDYYDTLAEVHFRQKDLNAALEAAQKAAAVQPRVKYFQARRAYFEALLKPAENPPPDPALQLDTHTIRDF